MKYNCGIYKITNVLNGKRYMGSSKNFKNRKRKHFYELGKNTHHCRHLQFAYNKYGKENFIFEPIIDCKEEELIYYENYYLAYYQPEYNSTLDAKKRTPITKDFKEKISMANRGKIVSEETRKKLSEINKGKKLTEEQKNKLSLFNKGKVLSGLTKQRMSESRKGVPIFVKECKIHDTESNIIYTGISYKDLAKQLQLNYRTVSKIMNSGISIRKTKIHRYVPIK